MRLDLQQSVLPNGLRIASSKMPRVDGVSLGIWAAVGGLHEPARLNGASHFIEHLLFKGTAKRSARQLSLAIEGRGGTLDAYTQEDHTCFFARATSERLGLLMDVLADMLLRSRFAPRDVEKERGVILEEIAMYRDQPQQAVGEMLMAALWPRHALGRPLTGTEKSLAGLGRRELVDFMKARYAPRSIVIAAAGAVDHGELHDLAARHFGSLAPVRVPRPAAVPARWPQERMLCEYRETDQVHLALGFRTFGRHDPRRHALRVLSVLLGETMSSRLFQKIRERHGLAYAISSSMHLFDTTGVFSIEAGLDAERAVRAMDLVFGELRALCDRGPTPAELAMAREYVTGQTRLSLESSGTQMSWAGEQLVHLGRIIQPAEALRRIQNVEAVDVRRVAGGVLKAGRMSCAFIAPKGGPALELPLQQLAVRHLLS